MSNVTYILAIPCTDETRAVQCAAMLRSDAGFQVSGVTGRSVRLPWGGDPKFAHGVAQLAVMDGYADEPEACGAVIDALLGAGVITDDSMNSGAQ